MPKKLKPYNNVGELIVIYVIVCLLKYIRKHQTINLLLG